MKVIAIDGPAGSGKGTISKILAEKLNYIYVDTGVTYRSVALICIRNNINLEEKEKIIDISSKIDLEYTEDGRCLLNKEDVSDLIRSKEVTNICSEVSSILEVRKNMVKLQRKMSKNSNVVMEGRDITTVVFPNADYKFYLDASLESRVNRRFNQNKEKNINMTKEEIEENIKIRDYNDMHKEYGALKISDDAIYIDTSDLTIDEVVNKMMEVIK